MVHGGDHGDDGFAVGEAEDADLGAGEELLDDDFRAALAEDFVLHHGADGVFRGLAGLADEDALAQGKAVGLDDGGQGAGVHIGEGLFRVGEGLIGGGRDVIFFHEVLGEGFASLEDGGIFAGAEAGEAFGLQGVGHAEDQGVVGGDDDEIDGVLFCGGEGAGDVRSGAA